ncbi:MAG: TlpA family protein disulfide reductase [Muribaculaceae bacterium]|nr:TlpA family protein disulfide reductase [Muribaculaceae bacterium]
MFGAVMVLGTMTACVNDEKVPEWSLAVGDMCPAFTVTMNDGSVFDSTRLSSEQTVIVLFNTGCPDCQRELPELQTLYEQCNLEEVSFVCISREEDEASVSTYWHEHNLTLPYSAQTDRQVYNLFANIGIPRTYIVDRSGKIISTDIKSIIP